MNWRDRITVDPKVLVGKPVIKGTRIAVEFLMELLAGGSRALGARRRSTRRIGLGPPDAGLGPR